MSNIFSIVEPATCTAAGALPVLPTDLCQLPPKRAEIDVIVFKGSAAGPTDMSLAADWVSKIDNTDATGAKMRFLVGSGSVSDPEDTTFTGARDTEHVTDRVRTIEFVVTDLSDPLVYDYLRTLQTGAYKPDIFYQSLGGWLYGKKVTAGPDEGIEVKSVSVKMPKERGKEGVDTATLTIKFSSIVDPDRVVSPLSL